MVVLEPSCASVFRDEMVNLFPNDENAKRLQKQTFLLSEFLEKKAPHFELPKLRRKAVVHGHCHHKSLMGMDDEENVLRKMGVDFEVLDSGCCGMAGAFGFENDHYDVAMKCGDRVLLPAVRQTPKDTLIITDGFSCHEQIRQTTDRRPLHLAQVIEMAMREGPVGPAGDYPESGYVHHPEGESSNVGKLALGAGVALAGIGIWWAVTKKGSSASKQR